MAVSPAETGGAKGRQIAARARWPGTASACDWGGRDWSAGARSKCDSGGVRCLVHATRTVAGCYANTDLGARWDLRQETKLVELPHPIDESSGGRVDLGLGKSVGTSRAGHGTSARQGRHPRRDDGRATIARRGTPPRVRMHDRAATGARQPGWGKMRPLRSF